MQARPKPPLPALGCGPLGSRPPWRAAARSLLQPSWGLAEGALAAQHGTPVGPEVGMGGASQQVVGEAEVVPWEPQKWYSVKGEVAR